MGSFELNWGNHPNGTVQSLVVEPVELKKRRPFELSDIDKGASPIDQLRPVEAVEAFCQGIVVTLTG